MNTTFCKNCGAPLEPYMTVCPGCGFPVENVNPAPVSGVPVPPAPSKSSVNAGAIIGIVIGVVIIILGVLVMNSGQEISTYIARTFSVSSASFGADFYTYIYDAADTIVDELSAINTGIENVTNCLADFVKAVSYAAGMLIIAVGLSTTALSITRIKK